MARHIELTDFDFLKSAVLDFPGYAHAGDNGHAVAHLNDTFDAFDGGHFNGHVEGSAMLGEKLDHAAAKRRFDNVGDKIFLSQFLDVHFAALGKGMLRRNDEGEFVFQNFGGLQLGVARDEGDSAEVEAVVHHFVRDVAGKHAVEADLYAGMSFAELGESGEQGVDGAFIDAESEFTALEAFEFEEPLLDFISEIEEAFGVFAKELAGVGEAHGACTANEERLAERVFELADGEADGRLGAVEAFGGTRKAALAGNCKKNLKFG